MASTAVCKKWASPDDWARYRGTITALYLDRAKTLRDVKRIMELEYFFYATEKMYKSKFNKWGVQKNLKHHQVGELLSLQNRRAAEGKASEVFIHGRRVDEARLNSYLNRQPKARRRQIEETIAASAVSASSVSSASASSAASSPSETSTDARQKRPTEGILCRTPSPGPRLARAQSIPKRLESPDSLRLPEECLQIMQTYIGGSDDAHFMWETNPGCPNLVTEWYSQIVIAKNLLVNGLTAQGFSMVSACYERYREMLQLQHPLLVVDTAIAMFKLSAVGMGGRELADGFVSYAAEMAQIVLGACHPLTLLFRRFRRAGWAGLTVYISNLVQYYLRAARIASRFDTELGVLHIYPKLVYYGLVDVEAAKTFYRSALAKLATDPDRTGQGERRRGTQQARCSMAWMHFYDGRCADAVAVVEGVIFDAREGEVDPLVEIDCCQLLECIARQRGDYGWAIDMLYRGIPLRDDGDTKAAFRESHRKIARRLPYLESLLRRVGRLEEADVVRKRFDDGWIELCGSAEGLAGRKRLAL
ncbi:Uu.00g039500.m01.CDS01 [Anthostomella pinea]|uniref:Uu.00g039500.m01.CDS01 n=1 Tax=Anthostomella pinea TaxID=933095 RepID=A0AAI8VAI3_9PEZI|nr:Uu.00g039500.m01.CDS01 [Anthostomella pinea]